MSLTVEWHLSPHGGGEVPRYRCSCGELHSSPDGVHRYCSCRSGGGSTRSGEPRERRGVVVAPAAPPAQVDRQLTLEVIHG